MMILTISGRFGFIFTLNRHDGLHEMYLYEDRWNYQYWDEYVLTQDQILMEL